MRDHVIALGALLDLLLVPTAALLIGLDFTNQGGVFWVGVGLALTILPLTTFLFFASVNRLVRENRKRAYSILP